MKAFDAHLDKRAKDGGFDYLTSRAFSRESTVEMKFRFLESQKPTPAGMNYFAMCSPIMPLGMLFGFLFLGKLDAMYTRTQFEHEDPTARRHAELTQALYVAAMREKNELEKRKRGLAVQFEAPDKGQCERATAAADREEQEKKTKEKAEKAEKLKENVEEPMLSVRGQQDIGKLIKNKTAMEGHLDKLRNEQDYSAVCRVSSRLDLLQKALKRLGC